jgi:hypothetical protein
MTVLAILLSGALAGLLSDPGGVDVFGQPGIGGVLLSPGGGGVTVAVLMAVAIAATVRRRVLLVGLTVAAATLAAVSALYFPSDSLAVLAGGILLGCIAAQSVSRIQQAALIGSFFAGLLCAGAVDALQYAGVPRRYADYLVETDVATPKVVPGLCVLVVVATVVIARRGPVGEGPHSTMDIRTASAVLLVLLAGLLVSMLFVHNLFQSSDGYEERWYLGLLVVPVLFVSAAVLPGRGGIPVLAGTAVLLTSTTTAGVGIDVANSAGVLELIALTAAAVAAGVALGLRGGHWWIGLILLALVCVTSLFDSPPLDNVHYVASLVVFPAVAAYLYVSLATPDPLPMTLGLALPVAVTVPMVVSYGWTAYTPLTDIDTNTFSPSTDLLLSTGGALATVVLAALGVRFLTRTR